MSKVCFGKRTVPNKCFVLNKHPSLNVKNVKKNVNLIYSGHVLSLALSIR